MRTHTTLTTQRQLRRSFWAEHGWFNPVDEWSYKRQHGDYRTDIRCAFGDYIDARQRDGQIDMALAGRVTL